MAGEFKACSVDGCNGDARGSAFGCRGLCAAHYGRYKRLGDPMAGGTRRGRPLRYITEEALTFKGEGCLKWPFGSDGQGYGRLKVRGRDTSAHRYICTLVHGEPPSEVYVAAHSCGNGHLGCINPRHLSWKTHSQNHLDKAVHGTHSRGERSAHSKLKEQEVREILSLRGVESQARIASRYGVAQTTIAQIHRGERWGWIKTVMD